MPASEAPQNGADRRLDLKQVLDSPPDDGFDRLTRLAARALAAPVALLSFLDGDRQWFKSTHGLQEPWSSKRETPLSHSVAQHVVSGRRPLAVSDAREEPLLRESLAVRELGIVSYLGVPLIDVDGAAVGAFAVAVPEPRDWRSHEIAMMEDFAATAMTELQLHQETERRTRAEERLRHAQRLEALGRLAGGVAHDFNNLLTVIAGNAAWLLDRADLDEQVRTGLDEIETAATRGARLTAQLLAFSRRQVFQLEALDLAATVRGVERLLRRLLPANVELRADLAAGPPVHGDRGQIEQVLMNLVINARDALPQGGRITIATGAFAEDPAAADTGRRSWLRIEDTGTGIEPELEPHLFEPFFTTKAGGTGLGLATVYGIVRQMNGHIDVETEPGRGTAVTVSFPETQSAAAEHPPAAPLAEYGGGETILVVDDDFNVRRVAERLLTHLGYHVLGAHDRDSALATWQAAHGAVDLLICDVVLSGVSGAAVAAALHERRPDLPVVLVSGYTDDVVLSQLGERGGSSGFLAKPFTLESIGRVVREALARPAG